MIFAAEFPGLIYNAEHSSYNLTPLPGSVMTAGKIFATNRRSIPIGDLGSVAVAIEISEEIDEANYYKSIERLKNLICLAFTSKPQENRWRDISEQTLDEVVDNNLADQFYNPDIRYAGQMDWDSPLRVAAYSQLISRMPAAKQKRFWQALQTFAYAREIAHLPNPQYRYTLYLSLHLASIDQLANNPTNLHNRSDKLSCPVCGELSMTHNTSHVEEIEKFIRSLVEPDRVEVWIELLRRLYHPVRSNFVHDGELAGLEDIGGFIALWTSNVELAENDINIMILNKMLLEKYLQQNQPTGA